TRSGGAERCFGSSTRHKPDDRSLRSWRQRRQESSMNLRNQKLGKLIAVGVGCVLLVGLSAAAMPLVKTWWPPATMDTVSAHVETSEAALIKKDTLRLPPDVVRSLQIETGEVKQAKYSQDLEMFGQFAPDADRLFRIRARFGGHVAEVAQVLNRD